MNLRLRARRGKGALKDGQHNVLEENTDAFVSSSNWNVLSINDGCDVCIKILIS